MTTVEEMLAHEALLMGRDVEYINQHDSTFNNDGKEHVITLLVYRCAPVQDVIEARFAVYVDGRAAVGGIV